MSGEWLDGAIKAGMKAWITVRERLVTAGHEVVEAWEDLIEEARHEHELEARGQRIRIKDSPAASRPAPPRSQSSGSSARTTGASRRTGQGSGSSGDAKSDDTTSTSSGTVPCEEEPPTNNRYDSVAVDRTAAFRTARQRAIGNRARRSETRGPARSARCSPGERGGRRAALAITACRSCPRVIEPLTSRSTLVNQR